MKRDVGLDAVNEVLAQRRPRACDYSGAIASVHDQLGNQRIVLHRDAVAVIPNEVEGSRGVTLKLSQRDPSAALGMTEKSNPDRAKSVTQNFVRTPKCRVDVRTDIIETDPVYEAGMKQHFHRLWLHTAEEELRAFAMKFLQRDFERV